MLIPFALRMLFENANLGLRQAEGCTKIYCSGKLVEGESHEARSLSLSLHLSTLLRFLAEASQGSAAVEI